MKTLTIVCILFFLLGCKQNTDENTIYGSWTTVKDIKYKPEEILDSIVFVKPNSLTSYYVMNGKIEDSLNATFRIHNNQLITQYGDSTFTFEIIELNSQKLITRQVSNNILTTSYRLK